MDLRDIKEFFLDMSNYVIVIIVVFLITMYVASLQQVVGPSMETTLNDGDVLILSKAHYHLFEVKRNDIIAFDDDNGKYLIKRVIGLPGEHIAYKDGVLYINGEGFTESVYEGIGDLTADFDLKDLEGNYEIIPEDMYLVLGDNRQNSLDSRELGLIAKEDILGKNIMQVWPLNDFGFLK